jgi:hypothetical protein
MLRWWRALSWEAKFAFLALLIAVVAVPPGWLALQQGRQNGGGTSANQPPSGPPLTTDFSLPTVTQVTSPPTASTTITPSELFKGKLDITAAQSVDLDNQTADGSWVFGDIWDSQSDIYYNDNLEPQDVASGQPVTLSPINSSATGRQACARASRFASYIDGDQIEVGSRYCVHTNKGNWALLRVDSLPSEFDSPPTLTFDVTVWS